MLPLLHNNHLFFFPAQNTRKYVAETQTQTQRPVNALYVTIEYRSTSTNFWFGCEGWKVQTQREAPLEEMQLWIFCRKTSFSNLDFSFSLIKLYHSGAKRCISANKWIFGKFPFPLIFATSCFYLLVVLLPSCINMSFKCLNTWTIKHLLFASG